jgi:hypothetical protein
MAGEYFMNWTDATIKPPFVLNLNTKDTSTTCLTLFGKGSSNYGEGLQENLLRLLENSCSASAPLIKTEGQLWYDSGTKTVKVWDGAAWNSTNTQVSTSAPTSPMLGTIWFNTTDGGLNYWNGIDWKLIVDRDLFDTTMNTKATINPTTAKDGDIRVVGAVVYVYASTAWKQVFPAVYQ